MRACIYSRVSTSGQDVQNQYTVLTEWAKQRGFEVVAVYQEEESAWKAGHQKELAKLLADARKGTFLSQMKQNGQMCNMKSKLCFNSVLGSGIWKYHSAPVACKKVGIESFYIQLFARPLA